MMIAQQEAEDRIVCKRCGGTKELALHHYRPEVWCAECWRSCYTTTGKPRRQSQRGEGMIPKNVRVVVDGDRYLFYDYGSESLILAFNPKDQVLELNRDLTGDFQLTVQNRRKDGEGFKLSVNAFAHLDKSNEKLKAHMGIED